MAIFNIEDLQLKNDQFFLISGPCVVESEDLSIRIAEHLLNVTSKLGIPYIFKASYRKANRTSVKSFQGIGDEKALRILQKLRTELNVPILTDVHETKEVEMVAEVADIIQIPAFLARQTDLLNEVGKSGKGVNIKKAQFMSPGAMEFAIEKVRKTGNNNIMVTERGTFFGYQDLVVDYRNLVYMKSLGCPVIYDATHSLQKPNQDNGVSGGNPEYIFPLARAAMAIGINGIFIETHPVPENALSDGENMLNLGSMEDLLKELQKINDAVRAL